MNKPKLKYPSNWNEKIASKVSNGCGPAGSKWKCWLIPETIYGVKITQACKIHDFMYFMGKSLREKKEADEVFLENMVSIFEAQPWWIKTLNKLRTIRAYEYYLAVSYLGKSAFLNGKQGINDEALPEAKDFKSKELKKYYGNFKKYIKDMWKYEKYMEKKRENNKNIKA